MAKAIRWIFASIFILQCLISSMNTLVSASCIGEELDVCEVGFYSVNCDRNTGRDDGSVREVGGGSSEGEERLCCVKCKDNSVTPSPPPPVHVTSPPPVTSPITEKEKEPVTTTTTSSTTKADECNKIFRESIRRHSRSPYFDNKDGIITNGCEDLRQILVTIEWAQDIIYRNNRLLTTTTNGGGQLTQDYKSLDSTLPPWLRSHNFIVQDGIINTIGKLHNIRVNERRGCRNELFIDLSYEFSDFGFKPQQQQEGSSTLTTVTEAECKNLLLINNSNGILVFNETLVLPMKKPTIEDLMKDYYIVAPEASAAAVTNSEYQCSSLVPESMELVKRVIVGPDCLGSNGVTAIYRFRKEVLNLDGSELVDTPENLCQNKRKIIHHWETFKSDNMEYDLYGRQKVTNASSITKGEICTSDSLSKEFIVNDTIQPIFIEKVESGAGVQQISIDTNRFIKSTDPQSERVIVLKNMKEFDAYNLYYQDNCSPKIIGDDDGRQKVAAESSSLMTQISEKTILSSVNSNNQLVTSGGGSGITMCNKDNTHTIVANFKASDPCGNKANITLKFLIKETTPPVIEKSSLFDTTIEKKCRRYMKLSDDSNDKEASNLIVSSEDEEGLMMTKYKMAKQEVILLSNNTNASCQNNLVIQRTFVMKNENKVLEDVGGSNPSRCSFCFLPPVVKQTFIIKDDEPPVWISPTLPPTYIHKQCLRDVGNDTLDLVLRARDNCDEEEFDVSCKEVVLEEVSEIEKLRGDYVSSSGDDTDGELNLSHQEPFKSMCTRTGNNRYITRTWEATDECGNVRTHKQVIDVHNTSPPKLHPNYKENVASQLCLMNGETINSHNYMCIPGVSKLIARNLIVGRKDEDECGEKLIFKYTGTTTKQCSIANDERSCQHELNPGLSYYYSHNDTLCLSSRGSIAHDSNFIIYTKCGYGTRVSINVFNAVNVRSNGDDYTFNDRCRNKIPIDIMHKRDGFFKNKEFMVSIDGNNGSTVSSSVYLSNKKFDASVNKRETSTSTMFSYTNINSVDEEDSVPSAYDSNNNNYAAVRSSNGSVGNASINIMLAFICIMLSLLLFIA